MSDNLLAAKLLFLPNTIITVSLTNTVAAKQNPHFAVKFRVLTVILAVKRVKKAAVKDNLGKSRARQTRKQACSLSRASPYV